MGWDRPDKTVEGGRRPLPHLVKAIQAARIAFTREPTAGSKKAAGIIPV